MSRIAMALGIGAQVAALVAGVVATANASDLGALTGSYVAGFAVLAVIVLATILTLDRAAILATAAAAGLLALHGCWFWAVTWRVLYTTDETRERCPPLAGGFDRFEGQYFPAWLACLGRSGERAILTSPAETVVFTLIPLALAAAAALLVVWVARRYRLRTARPL